MAVGVEASDSDEGAGKTNKTNLWKGRRLVVLICPITVEPREPIRIPKRNERRMTNIVLPK